MNRWKHIICKFPITSAVGTSVKKTKVSFHRVHCKSVPSGSVRKFVTKIGFPYDHSHPQSGSSQNKNKFISRTWLSCTIIWHLNSAVHLYNICVEYTVPLSAIIFYRRTKSPLKWIRIKINKGPLTARHRSVSKIDSETAMEHTPIAVFPGVRLAFCWLDGTMSILGNTIASGWQRGGIRSWPHSEYSD